MESTRHSLLARLRQPDAGAAWEQFCLQYGGPILRYARKLGLNEADAADVMQESLLALLRQLPDFSYDPARGRFRNFLLTIVHRQVQGLYRRRGRRPEDPLPADFEPVAPAAPESDNWQEAFFDEVWLRLRRSGALQPRTVEVFEAYAIRGEDPAAVGKKCGVSANTVYQIRNRVIALLRKEVERLRRDLEGEDADL